MSQGATGVLFVVIPLIIALAVMTLAVRRMGCDACGTCTYCTGMTLSEMIRANHATPHTRTDAPATPGPLTTQPPLPTHNPEPQLEP